MIRVVRESTHNIPLSITLIEQSGGSGDASQTCLLHYGVTEDSYKVWCKKGKQLGGCGSRYMWYLWSNQWQVQKMRCVSPAKREPIKPGLMRDLPHLAILLPYFYNRHKSSLDTYTHMTSPFLNFPHHVRSSLILSSTTVTCREKERQRHMTTDKQLVGKGILCVIKVCDFCMVLKWTKLRRIRNVCLSCFLEVGYITSTQKLNYIQEVWIYGIPSLVYSMHG
jgi:hypothetical protein